MAALEPKHAYWRSFWGQPPLDSDRRINDVMCALINHEDELSDGFSFYGAGARTREAAVARLKVIAIEILRVLATPSQQGESSYRVIVQKKV